MGLGAIIGGVGKAIGTATSFKNLLGLGNGNWEEQMEQQFQNEKELMGLQHQYNEAMAQQKPGEGIERPKPEGNEQANVQMKTDGNATAPNDN